ncbi:MAG: gliding motility-associated C-terminal domain-containing protein [Bacteroidota bacterium]
MDGATWWFEVEDYDNVNIVFAGISNGGKELQSGTYFYRLEFLDKKTTETGYLSLKR